MQKNKLKKCAFLSNLPVNTILEQLNIAIFQRGMVALISFYAVNPITNIQFLDKKKMQKVQRLYRQKDYGLALEQAKQLPRIKQTLVMMSKILTAMNEPDMAENYFLLATEPEVEITQVISGLIERGKFSYNLERYNEARKNFRQAYDLDKTNIDANYYLGILEEADGELKNSKKYLRACLRLDPGNRKYEILLQKVQRRIEKQEAMEKTPLQALKAKMRHLQEKIQRLETKKAQNLCVACIDYEATFANTECGHCSYCSECVERIKNQNCPICKKKGTFFKIYKV